MRTAEKLGQLWLTEVDLGEFKVRGVLIPGEERVAIWDTLSHPDDMKAFLPMLAGREPVIVYSHADWDHVWGTEGIGAGNYTIVAHDLCKKRFAAEVAETLTEKTADDPGRWQAVRLHPPTLTFTESHRVDLGSTALFLHHLPGHTEDSIVGFLPDEGVLLVGDAVEHPLPQVPAGCDLARWIAELRRWQANPQLRTVIPSHGQIGGAELLAGNIVYLQHLLDGREPAVPEPLEDFYRETHRENVGAWCLR